MSFVKAKSETHHGVSTSSTHKLAIAIVTFNSSSVLPRLLDSIPEGLTGVEDVEVFIVDNDSGDTTVEIAETHPVGAKVIRMGWNAGYAAAINAAATAAQADAELLILNPDLQICGGAISPLLKHSSNASVGIVVPRNFKEDGTTDPTLRREPSVVTAWADAVLGGKLAGYLGLGEIISKAECYDHVGPVQWATGSALLVTARARRAVGDWDESYFLYSEEVDYQRRVREAGFEIVYVPDSQVVHAGGEYSFNTSLFALLTTNRVRYYGRHHGIFLTSLFRLGVATGHALRYWRSSTHRAALRCLLMPLKPAYEFRREEPR